MEDSFPLDSGRSCQDDSRTLLLLCLFLWGFPDGSDSKESACNAAQPGSIPGSGRSPGGGSDNPLYYSCLENSMDRGARQVIVHRIAKSWT